MADKGLRLDVYTTLLYRGSGTISAVCDTVTLIHPSITRGLLHEPTEHAPAVALSTSTGVLSVVPVARPEHTNGPAFSGSFVYSPDWRFVELITQYYDLASQARVPVMFRDRFEYPTRLDERARPVVYPADF